MHFILLLLQRKIILHHPGQCLLIDVNMVNIFLLYFKAAVSTVVVIATYQSTILPLAIPPTPPLYHTSTTPFFSIKGSSLFLFFKLFFHCLVCLVVQ